ncbi:MAG: hypothetical protein JSV04_07700 [Candidatus Heimdallarchaeota archaeon]|nr:MAG: hypothetical protein JSV04_07700 [Candidatus Heimdallarchaeota archaeon]
MRIFRISAIILLFSSLLMLSGCIETWEERPVLDLELINENEARMIDNFINITFTNLSSYPTLEKALLEIVDSPKNSSGHEISTEEMTKIKEEILQRPDGGFHDYIAFRNYIIHIRFTFLL